MSGVSAIIPAYNAQATIGATVRAARALLDIHQVIVVDDGSADATHAAAREAGAEVLRLPHNRGKGAALRAGLAEAAGDLVLLLDADLGDSASLASALVEPVANNTADMTIAHFLPPEMAAPEETSDTPETEGDEAALVERLRQTGYVVQKAASIPAPASRKGGFGLVKGLAAFGLRALTGQTLYSPLSGQRCLPRARLAQVGLADGFGVEVGLTLEASRRGWRIREVPLAMTHAATGRDWSGFEHRGRQFLDVLRVLLGAAYGLGWPALGRRRMLLRLLVFAAALVWLPAMGRFAPVGFLPLTLFSLAVAAALVVPLFALLSKDMIRPNYRGLHLPTSFGLLFVIVWLAGTLFPWPEAYLAALPLIIVWAVLGLLDDHSTSRTRGFRGHLQAFSQGRVTTGAAKLFFGGGVSLLAAWLISGGGWAALLVNALLIALCTNLLNLLDLRPGRALKGFFVLGGLAWALNAEAALLCAPLFAAVLVYAPIDLGARAMMGDVGSNILGAVAGLALALSLGAGAKLVLLALLILIHVYAEIASLSNLIERAPLLRWLDALGRADE